jgi:cysteine desulfurase/selenocysteine lyase
MTLTHTFDVTSVRADFPILSRQIGNKPLVYLDNAATSQKPQQVIDAISHYYSHYNSNVHRGLHKLSEEATEAYEGAREKVRAFINAERVEEIIYTRGTTEGINLVAHTYGRRHLKKGDAIIIGHAEHHSNIVPWQMLCQEVGAVLKVVPVGEDGALDMEVFKTYLQEGNARLVAMGHTSNAMGIVNPVREIVALAHAAGAVVMIDGAQATPHGPVDVQDLDVDFFAFSGHKMYGPTGIGILYGKAELLNDMPPWMGGGDMIKTVSFSDTVYNDLPNKFEAGTPNIAGAIGLGAAVDYLNTLDWEGVRQHEADLVAYGHQVLGEIEGLRIVGTAPEKVTVFSFVLDYAHPSDVGTLLSHIGLAVRTGHHCAQPLMDRLGVPATVRASLAFYNTKEELDILVEGLNKVRKVFG